MAAADWPRHVAELEDVGFTVVPGVFTQEFCARARAHMDDILAPRDTSKGGAASARHPIPGAIMAEICTAPAFLAGAEALWRAPVGELRLNEQVPIRTDPWPTGHPDAPEPGTKGYHCDFTFQTKHFAATPRQVYFQTFSIFSEGGVKSGGACTMVVPRSHRRTMALADETDGSAEELDALHTRIVAASNLENRQQCIDEFGIDPAEGVEIPAPEGALVIFCPFCLHSGSPNVHGEVSRYVVVQSFQHHAAAELLRENLARKKYLKGFHQDTHDSLAKIAPSLREMLRGKHLWGEAMREELAAFKEQGFFLSKEPLIAPEVMARIDGLQREVEPEWRAREWPAGVNIQACQFLMVLQRGGEELLAVVEQAETMTLAVALLGLDSVATDTGAAGAGLEGLVIEACGLGDTLRLDDYPEIEVSREAQIAWHSDSSSKLAFRTAIDPQGAGTANASLRVLPRSHERPRAEVEAELAALLGDAEKGQHVHAPHPDEVAVALDAATTLIWNPTTWHATEAQRGGATRRALGWNYGVRGASRSRDAEAVRLVFAGEWEAWPEARQKLWGVWEEPVEGALAARL